MTEEKSLMGQLVEQMELSVSIAQEFKKELDDYKKLIRRVYAYQVQYRLYDAGEMSDQLTKLNA